MLPSFNMKKVQALMKQMGISQEEIDATKVTIEKKDGEKIIIENPSVTKMNIQGQETFQITGEISEQGETSSEDLSEKDIQTIMEKTGCTKEQAEEALKKSKGDLVEAIIELGGS